MAVVSQPGAAGLPDRQRLFSKYYRAPHAKRQAGTGLGLYLVRSLAHTLGGRIEYEPEGDSVRFVLSLPQAPGPAA
jgi:signal transduction histidine kinase